jgi:hypothetical protein
MTMAEFRTKYGHQASGLRLLVDELITRAVNNPNRGDPAPLTDLVNAINDGFQDLQSALINANLKDWYID